MLAIRVLILFSSWFGFIFIYKLIRYLIKGMDFIYNSALCCVLFIWKLYILIKLVVINV